MKLILVLFFILNASADDTSPSQMKIVHFPSGNLTLGGELYKPKGDGPFPAVLYNHGSAEKFLSDTASKVIGPLYAAHGWVFFMPYRRGQGLSMAAGPYILDQIQASMDQGGQKAANETMIRLLTTDHLNDQLAGLAWLKNQKFVQANRIAVDGQSFGGIETVLGAEKYPFCAAIDAAGGSMSWKEAPELHTVMVEAARNSKSPAFFFQAENDFDTTPTKLLSSEMKSAGKTADFKIYPPFGDPKSNFDGHSFAWLGSATWFPDVYTFLQEHCP